MQEDQNTGTDRTVERLDYSKPPRGYEVALDDDQEINAGRWRWVHEAQRVVVGEAEEDEVTATAAAWSHHKERHDPPGMEVEQTTLRQGQQVVQDVWTVGVDYAVICAASGLALLSRIDWFIEQQQARAAAWVWYDRRLALADRLDCRVAGHIEHIHTKLDGIRALQPADETCARFATENGAPSHVDMFDLWPRILTWSNEQVAAVERWLVDPTAEMTEVLRT